MSTPQFRAGNPLAPEKGAFPLDHFGECTSFKEKYLECLRREKADSNRCKLESKMYLECRMAKELMAEQPLATLGFREEHDDKDENNNNNNNDTENEKNAREEENEKNGFVAGARRARQQRREMEESRRSRR
jgi:cytochrome c oxidase assembly protein subunit 19